MTSIHKLNIEGINGEIIRFADFKGKKLIIVNVASKCGFTTQYQQLQEVYNTFKGKLIILAIPCNDFGGQEPDSNSEIDNFCKINFGVTFPIASKIKIDNHPIYNWLTKKELNCKLDSIVKWNFQKYLIDEAGILVNCLSSSISPLDPQILDWIESS